MIVLLRQRDWVNLRHRWCEAAGERPDANRIVDDLDRLADRQLTADELQRYTEDIEFELDKKPARPTMWRGPRGLLKGPRRRPMRSSARAASPASRFSRRPLPPGF